MSPSPSFSPVKTDRSSLCPVSEYSEGEIRERESILFAVNPLALSGTPEKIDGVWVVIKQSHDQSHTRSHTKNKMMQQIIDNQMAAADSLNVDTPLFFFAQRFVAYTRSRDSLTAQLVEAQSQLEATKKICEKDAWKFTAKGSKGQGQGQKRIDPRIQGAQNDIDAVHAKIQALDESAREIIEFIEEQKAFEAKREAEDLEGEEEDDDMDDTEPWSTLPPYKAPVADESEDEGDKDWSTSIEERYMRHLAEATLTTIKETTPVTWDWNWNTPIGKKSYLQRVRPQKLL